MKEISNLEISKTNHRVFENNESVFGLDLPLLTGYDKEMVSIRHSIISKYGVTGKNIIDIGCGTGTYLLPIINKASSTVAFDFSKNMLEALAEKEVGPKRSMRVQGDARNLPFADETFELAFSFCSLYYVPNVSEAIKEIGRILKPKGHAILELGNSFSINQLVSEYTHIEDGCAKPAYVRTKEFMNQIDLCGFRIIEHRCFQLVPFYGVPSKLKFLWPFLHPQWKKVAGVKVRGKMLDEWISTAWPFRELAFRHLIVACKE